VWESAQRVTGGPIDVEQGARRPGDPAVLFANPQKILEELGWKAKYTDLDAIVETAWRWHKNHPRGYG